MIKILILEDDEGFGAVTEFAGSIGWEDEYLSAEDGEVWTPQEADACEEAAIDYITSQGYVLVYGNYVHKPTEEEAQAVG
jgi:hypothetical protein